MMEKEQNEKKHPSINKSPVSFEDINPKWSSSARTPSMSPPKSSSAKSPSMSPPPSPKTPSMSPPKSPPKLKSWFDDFVFLTDEHEILFKSFPEKKQQMMIKMAEANTKRHPIDAMHRMLDDQLAKALKNRTLPFDYTYND
jgi:hypothetical protein